jgi:hypothetical protein
MFLLSDIEQARVRVAGTGESFQRVKNFPLAIFMISSRSMQKGKKLERRQYHD